MQTVSQFMDSQIPQRVRRILPFAFRTAYRAVDDLYKSEPLFSSITAQIGRGHVVAWAVDLQFERLMISGDLPFGYCWADFKKPTGKYLLIHLGGATLSISQLRQACDVPRDAHFRNDKNLSDQLCFDLSLINGCGVVDTPLMPHLILSHGYYKGGLSFVQIGLLDSSGRKWVYRTPNLLKSTYAIESNLPKPEVADEAVITLKDEIMRTVIDV